MKTNYVHHIDTQINKIPYVSMLVKTYNQDYKNSYMVRDVKQKGKDEFDLVVANQSQIYVFYEEETLTVTQLKQQIKATELKIFQILEDLLNNTTVTNLNSKEQI